MPTFTAKRPLADHNHSGAGAGGNTLLQPILKASGNVAALLQDSAGSTRGRIRVVSTPEFGFEIADGDRNLMIGGGVAKLVGRWWVLMEALRS